VVICLQRGAYCLHMVQLMPLLPETPLSLASFKSRLDFTAHCYASAVLAMGLCPSVCLSQVGVLLKRLNVRSQKQHNTIAQGLQFSDAKDLREINPYGGAKCRWGGSKSATFHK